MTTHAYALELEHEFRRIYPPIPVTADGFSISPQDTLEDGLNYLRAENLVKRPEATEIQNTCEFGNGSLAEYLQKTENQYNFQVLIEKLKQIKGHGLEEDVL